jgi:hypothetical protein
MNFFRLFCPLIHLECGICHSSYIHEHRQFFRGFISSYIMELP